MSPRPFGTTSTDDRRRQMVERQLRRRGISDERVLAAMTEVPRELFLTPRRRAQAYLDGAVPIGDGQTMSQPLIVALMTELLELKGDERVLEVGTGSGYGAAVLSRVAAEVVTIERHRSLAERARASLAEVGYENVEVRVGDGSRGAPDRAPFGGIAVTAASQGRPPSPLFEQLGPGAALVAPVRRGADEQLVRFRDEHEEPVTAVRFVPLVEDPEGEG